MRNEQKAMRNLFLLSLDELSNCKKIFLDRGTTRRPWLGGGVIRSIVARMEDEHLDLMYIIV